MGCGKQQAPNVTSEKTNLQASTANSNIINSQEFIKFIEKSGYKITTSKQDGKGVLNGNLTRIGINGDTIGIYEYKSNEEMEQEAKTIRADGSMIGNTIYEWKAKPHFYKSGNIIVSYIGDNIALIEKIESLMGQQFAGSDSKQLSQQKIIEIAYNSLTDKYKSDVINKDNPKVEETEYYYKVTFNAKSDAILGPIVVTVDKKSLRTSTSLRD
jgi:hypothetical protein